MNKDQQLANIALARELWLQVPPEQVVPGLGTWYCGTQACFGGHLARWPQFQALGVRLPTFGSPLFGLHAGRMFRVDEVLFGDPRIFHERGEHPADEGPRNEGSDIPDHEVVLRRLDWARENLKGTCHED